MLLVLIDLTNHKTKYREYFNALNLEWSGYYGVCIFFVISPFAFFDAISIGCLAAIVTKRVEIKKSVLSGMAITGWANWSHAISQIR